MLSAVEWADHQPGTVAKRFADSVIAVGLLVPHSFDPALYVEAVAVHAASGASMMVPNCVGVHVALAFAPAVAVVVVASFVACVVSVVAHSAVVVARYDVAVVDLVEDHHDVAVIHVA